MLLWVSIFLCECFFFLTDRWRLVVAGVTVDEVVRGEFGFGECFRGTLFFAFCGNFENLTCRYLRGKEVREYR